MTRTPTDHDVRARVFGYLSVAVAAMAQKPDRSDVPAQTGGGIGYDTNEDSSVRAEPQVIEKVGGPGLTRTTDLTLISWRLNSYY
jgi:hypothetical protein